MEKTQKNISATFIEIITILMVAAPIAALHAVSLSGNGILSPASTWLVVICCGFVGSLSFCSAIAVQNDIDESILDVFILTCILTFIGAIFTAPAFIITSYPSFFGIAL